MRDATCLVAAEIPWEQAEAVMRALEPCRKRGRAAGRIVDVYTIRGVPARWLDVGVERCIRPSETVFAVVIRRPGRFDGAHLDRLALVSRADGVAGRLEFDWCPSRATLRIVAGETEYVRDLPVLRAALDGSDLARILHWHAARWYRFLPPDDVASLAPALASSLPPGATIAEANRAASRLLYRAAYDAGWRKLTVREQQRLGLQGQWHRAEIVLARLAAIRGFGNPTGCGEETLMMAGCQPGDRPR